MDRKNGIERELETFKFLKKTKEKQIANLPEGSIKVYTQRKKEKNYGTYYRILENGENRIITRDKALIRKLSLKRFLEIQVKMMENYIGKLEEAVRIGKEISIENIIKEMPAALWKFLEYDTGENAIKTLEESRKQKMENWKAAPFLSNPYKYEKIRHYTSDGNSVRSKSELVIYEQLLQYGIVFKYECPLEIDGTVCYPDFTIMLPNGKIIYWEHAGMMSDEVYRNKHKMKMEKYEKVGIVPWENLIVTYDDPYGNIDINIIRSEIENKLLRY